MIPCDTFLLFQNVYFGTYEPTYLKSVKLERFAILDRDPAVQIFSEKVPDMCITNL